MMDVWLQYNINFMKFLQNRQILSKNSNFNLLHFILYFLNRSRNRILFDILTTTAPSRLVAEWRCLLRTHHKIEVSRSREYENSLGNECNLEVEGML